MKKIMITTAAALLLAAGHSAQAQIVSDGSASFTSAGSGTQTVNYFVYYSGGVYTYAYEFNVSALIGEFEVNVNPSLVSTIIGSGSTTLSGLASANSATLGSTLTTAFTTGTSTSYSSVSQVGFVEWFTGASGSPSDYAYGYTSIYGPTAGTGSLIDGGTGPWGDNPGSGGTPIPVPAPVPEASTVMAGALMLLPLGIGALRALRKERTA
jgi:hypothetical protein